MRVTAGDFNGDATIDLVTVNIGSGGGGNLSLLRSNGDGTFQTPITVAAGNQPLDVTVGDFNRDGKLDLAAADAQGQAVVVRLGNGDGTFQPPVVIPVPEAPQSIVAADLNGDGKLDLITNGVILLGNGNGTFQSPTSFASSVRPTLVRVADLNGDGKLDIVTATGLDNLLSVWLGNGDGTVGTPRHYVAGAFPVEIQILDLNGDGIPDLLVSNVNTDHISNFIGKGDGTFVAASTYLAVPTIGQGAFGVAVADFNGDGIPDLVVANGKTPSNGLPAAVILPGLGLVALARPSPSPDRTDRSWSRATGTATARQTWRSPWSGALRTHPSS